MPSLDSNLPIIFVCWDNPPYLKYALAQAALTCPHLPIVLLGDASNANHPNLHHALISDFQKSAQHFATVYKHLSPNNAQFELRCFQRWFIIRDFLAHHRLSRFAYLDCDVLLYCDPLREISEKFAAADFVASDTPNSTSPHNSYWINPAALPALCDLILNHYTNPALLLDLEQWLENLHKRGIHGGVCDMTLLKRFRESNQFKFAGAREPLNNSFYDDNLNVSDGFQMAGNFKKIIWQKNRPHARLLANNQLLLFNTIHFQGPAKPLMRRNFQGPGGRHNLPASLLEHSQQSLRLARRIAGKIKRTLLPG